MHLPPNNNNNNNDNRLGNRDRMDGWIDYLSFSSFNVYSCSIRRMIFMGDIDRVISFRNGRNFQLQTEQEEKKKKSKEMG